ncbi:type I-E CRISPR-associated protein Cse1/CasA [Nocardia thailandica]|uniref:Type I-E CRISPR-associated protein Cse1/CasA n=1 Tax=Nocardia thailandica TaxID=257275 RepID=A0ABW6PI03_9NOCA
MSARPAFDLLDEDWITVADRFGRTQDVSVRAVLRDPGQFSALAGEVPTQQFAILRLLLAILHRGIVGESGDPITVWSRLWSQWPTERIQAYLTEHKDRFGLFDAEEPFFQVPDLRSSKDAVSSLDKFIADVPNGAKYFTTRAGVSAERMSFAEAARWLVHVHAFDPSGIKTGAVGDSRVKGGRGYPIGLAWSGNLGGLYVEGQDLRETLLLNLVLADRTGNRVSASDLPAWERATDGPTVRPDPTPTGRVDLFTWQSRRVRLVANEQTVTGLVLCNGDALEPFNKQHFEPMTRWRYSKIQSAKAGEARYYPAAHRPELSLWRGLRSVLDDMADTTEDGTRDVVAGVVEWIRRLLAAGALTATHPLRLHAVGMQYINNLSIVGDIVDDEIGFAADLLGSDPALRVTAVNAIKTAERAVNTLGDLAADLAVAAGGEADAARQRTQEEAFFALEAPYRRWLGQLNPNNPDHAENAARWERAVYPVVRRHGDDLISTAPPQAWAGRPHPSRTLRSGEPAWIAVGSADNRFRHGIRQHLPAVFSKDRTPPKGQHADDEPVAVIW